MTDLKKPRLAYNKHEISHPYLLLSNDPYILISDDQFALLDDSMDRNTIQYDHMYVQTTPIQMYWQILLCQYHRTCKS